MRFSIIWSVPEFLSFDSSSWLKELSTCWFSLSLLSLSLSIDEKPGSYDIATLWTLLLSYECLSKSLFNSLRSSFLRSSITLFLMLFISMISWDFYGHTLFSPSANSNLILYPLKIPPFKSVLADLRIYWWPESCKSLAISPPPICSLAYSPSRFTGCCFLAMLCCLATS